MTLLEWYFDNGVDGTGSPAITVTILPLTQWKYHFISGAVQATGSSTVTTTTTLEFVNSLNTLPTAPISRTTTTTDTALEAQQYPAGSNNFYFSPLVGNRLEEIIGKIQNAAGVSGNYILFSIEVDLDGDFDE